LIKNSDITTFSPTYSIKLFGPKEEILIDSFQ